MFSRSNSDHRRTGRSGIFSTERTSARILSSNPIIRNELPDALVRGLEPDPVMIAKPLCPDASILGEFAHGRLSGFDSEVLKRHVSTCQHCLETIRSIRSGDTPPQELTVAPRPELPGLQETDVTLSWGERPGSEPVVQALPNIPERFPFLRPSQSEGELGWLGPYRILGLLGGGGMGIVFRAEDPALKRSVALKVVKPQLVASSSVRTRFLEEAQALAALEHDHIVTVYQVGEDNGVPFLAMPLLRGQTLEHRLEAVNGVLPTDDILRIGREIATGLAVAHARGLVHRDIKPANLWIEAARPNSPERIKILDFGLVQALTGEDVGGGSGKLMGTPSYMAPEQALGKATDSRTDLFSLGIVLYQMATGRRPFVAPDLTGILMAIALDKPTAPREVNPAIPLEIEKLILQLLNKEPGDRPESAEAVVVALSEVEASRRPKPSRRRWVIGSIVAVLLAAGVTGAAVLMSTPDPISVTVPEPPADPGEVTLEYDEPDKVIVLRHDGEERTIDLAKEKTLSLPPGEWTLSPAVPVEKRFLWPKTVLVESNAKKTVPLRLIGEVRKHCEHSELAFGALLVDPVKDGPVVYSVVHDRTIVEWNLARPDQRKSQEHENTLLRSPLRCVALSPDGQTVATGSGDVNPPRVQEVLFWNVEKFARVANKALSCKTPLNALAYSPDGKHLVTGEQDGTLILWNSQLNFTDNVLLATHGPGGVSAIVYLPGSGGKRLLTTGGDGKIIERSAADLSSVRTLATLTKPVRALAVSPDGKKAITADDATIRVWDLATGAERTWGASGAILTLAISPDNTRLITGDVGGTIRLWDIAKGCEIVHFDGHKKAVKSIAFLLQGRQAVSGSDDGTVRLWELPK